MTTELEVAVAAARAAGCLLYDRWGDTHQVRWKGEADPVTEMDRMAEDLIIHMLREAFPDYGLVGEECGDQRVAGRPCWLIDPLDGTTNYMRGYPFFSVSIGLEHGGEPILGAVYNPLLDEMYAAERGGGATLNGETIHVSTVGSLSETVLASGFPYEARINDVDNAHQWRRFLKRVLSMRSDGSAALDLCHVAAGRIDGFWELELGPWDIAAGAVIVTEAGGRVTEVQGARFDPYGRNVLASNGHVHTQMLDVLTGNGR
jgi:myo-inositol-1(or 4)-monophosphatase